MKRQRLTITLREDILSLLDGIIDRDKIRNRSHAVEYLLSQTLVPQKVKVLILAGGQGVRFRPLTYEIPKAMIPIAGKPLLQHTLEKLHKSNLDDVVISIGHLGEKIKDYFGDGSRFGMNITYLEQNQKKIGTAQPLKQAEALVYQNTFLVVYADVFSDISYIDLIEFHRAQKNITVTMALAPVEQVKDWGVAKLVGTRIATFEEKPKQPRTKSHLVNAGAYVMEPQIFNYIRPNTVRLENEVWPRLAEEGKLSGYAFDGVWYDVSTPAVYATLLAGKK